MGVCLLAPAAAGSARDMVAAGEALVFTVGQARKAKKGLNRRVNAEAVKNL